MFDDDLDPESIALLERFGCDRSRLAAAQASLARGDDPHADNVVHGHVAAPDRDDITRLPELGTEARAAMHRRGADAIRAGQVGVIYLAGGMATRFGGVVKAVVPVLDGKSFLDLKLADAAYVGRQIGGAVPGWLLSSFATHATLVETLAQSPPPIAIECVPQFVSLRLTGDGRWFRDADGRVSPYAPGHGDLTFALRRAGAIARFRAAGGRYLHMSNVDNLAATLDPAVIGAHIVAGRPITAEVVAKDPGDRGGAPARVDGRVQILESFRFPRDFDQDTIAVFNTNSFVLDAEAIDRDFDLTYFHVAKSVDGATAIQYERLVGELTAHMATQFLHVERTGMDGRFQPIKDPPELEARRAAISAILRARGEYSHDAS